jgi:hypothetical protein
MHSKLSRRRLLQIAGATGAAVTALGYVIGESLVSRRPPMLQRHLPVVGVITSDILSPAARENRLPGTPDWEIAAGVDQSFIQGYANQVSTVPGETVTLYISTKVPSTYNIDVYRIGWYGGAGGRLHFSRHHLKSFAQGNWTFKKGLVNCPTALIDPQTHLVDANWQPSFELPVGTDWVSGVYLIKLTATLLAGLITSQSYIPLVVREPHDQAAILFSLPVNTYQAYNKWGGGSLYTLTGVETSIEESAGAKATKVSFNRPYDRSAGAGDFLAWDIHTVRWIEREDFDVSYTTNVDTAANPDSLLHHRVILSGGHDEYWTKSMRDGMEAARDQGVSLAFFGANAAYWQARLEPDHAGKANRTLVCYKVAAHTKSPQAFLTQDPLYREQPEIVTAQWRDVAINRPENALLGLMYHSYINFVMPHGNGYYLPDWVVKPGKLDRLMEGTGLTAGKHIKGGLLGYEYDSVWDNRHTPSSLVVLAESPIIDVYGAQQLAHTAYYRADSGALVFDAGTMWWGWGLSGISPHGAYQANLLKGNESIKALTRNVLDAMLHASPVAPAIRPSPDPTPNP